MRQTVLCCGMVRSGSTVLYQMASAIVELRGIGERAGYYEPPNRPPERARDGWAVYKVPWLGENEKQLIRDGALALYSYRDIEDALASACRAFQIPEGDRWLWRALTEGHMREMNLSTATSIRFDFIRDHLRGAVSLVAGSLAQATASRMLNASEIDAIARSLALDRQKARVKVAPFDPHTLLFPTHFD